MTRKYHVRSLIVEQPRRFFHYMFSPVATTKLLHECAGCLLLSNFRSLRGVVLGKLFRASIASVFFAFILFYANCASGMAQSSSNFSIMVRILPKASAASAYSARLAANGGTPPYVWSVTKGQLPPGLRLSSEEGIISGTPTSSGYYAVGITALDSSSPVQKSTVNLAMSVAAAAITPLTMATPDFTS